MRLSGEGMLIAMRVLCAFSCLVLFAGLAAAQDVPETPPGTQERGKGADPRDVRPPGPSLLSVYSTQKTGIYLRDRSGATQLIWSGKPYDACALPNGSTLVCERAANRLLWLDAAGKVVWTKEGLSQPVDAEMSHDGKTIVVVLNGAGTVVGIDPITRKIMWTRAGFNNHYDVELTPDGGLIVADSQNNRVVWMDAKGKITRQQTFKFPNTVTHLRNGNTLVTTYSNGEAIEVDAGGRVVWKAKIPGGGSIFRAFRRRNGQTVIVEGEIGGDRRFGRVHVLSPQGRVLHTQRFDAGGLVDFEGLNDI
jgi:DNA-binding beta-propeller fold protein YncE